VVLPVPHKNLGLPHKSILHPARKVNSEREHPKNNYYEISPAGRNDVWGWNDGIANPAS